MPNPMQAVKAVKAAKAAAKMKMAMKTVGHQASIQNTAKVTMSQQSWYGSKGFGLEEGYNPYNSSGAKVAAVRTWAQKGTGTSARMNVGGKSLRSKRLDATYNIGRSKGFDPYNTHPTYAKAGQLAGATVRKKKK